MLNEMKTRYLSGKKIFCLTIVLLFSSICLAGEWNLTGSLNQGRECFCSVKLNDGRILVAGGHNSGALSSCEIYDPSTGEWSLTDSMYCYRYNFSMTILSDGKILAVGGRGGGGWTAEIFNPSTEIWENPLTLNYARWEHASILLLNGKILIVGGDAQNDYKGCELYDPETGIFTLTGFCIYQKVDHTLELLPDGRIMAIGGGNSSYEHCETYDPDTELWTEIASLNEPRYSHTSHLLPNGNIMAIAGAPSPYRSSCEIYDFQTEEWVFASSLEIGRTGHCSELLLNNKILIMGGQGETGSGSGYSCEIYNPTTNQWQTATSTYYGYSNFSSEVLKDERVLAIQSWCEIYTWNHQPVVSQPQSSNGLNEAIIGDVLTFSVTASDPDDDSIAVRINWGDEEISEWTELQPSGTTFESSHAWLELGEYEVCAQTADQWYFLNELCHNSISEWTEPVIITIFGIPEILIITEPLDFGTVYIGSDSTKTITISNIGNGILETDFSTNTNEFSVYPSNFNIDPGETLDIEITFAPTYEGTISDTLTILSNDPENPEIQIELTGDGETLSGVNNIYNSPVNSVSVYPNPFNSTTTISFSTTDLHRPKKIIIYNIKGQKVKTFPNLQINKSSNQQILWDGTDSNNQHVASGIYFYKLMISNEEIACKRMLLLK